MEGAMTDTLDDIRRRHAEAEKLNHASPFARAALLAHVAELERDRDEAQINAEKFRQSMYAVEKDALRLQTESDALRAELAEATRLLGMVWAPGMPEGVHRQVRAFLAASAQAEP
jgi:septation ring formation regulator EzrA